PKGLLACGRFHGRAEPDRGPRARIPCMKGSTSVLLHRLDETNLGHVRRLTDFARDVFRATAARMSALNALSSIASSSWKSMARRVLPSRLELKRPEGSGSEAPLAKVSLTLSL